MAAPLTSDEVNALVELNVVELNVDELTVRKLRPIIVDKLTFDTLRRLNEFVVTEIFTRENRPIDGDYLQVFNACVTKVKAT